MQRQHDASDVIYHGCRGPYFERVVAVESADGELIAVLPHLPSHSPTGMNWGYAGAGPCDTARSLLIDVLGPDAICPACQGTGRVTYLTEGDGYRPEPVDPQRHPQSRRGWPCGCSGGYKHLPYGAFADQFVSQWDDEWAISRTIVLAWLAAHTQQNNAASPAANEPDVTLRGARSLHGL